MSVLFKPKQNFTMVHNKLLYANNLSMKAKLLYIYLISKPERWNFSHERIAKEMMEGKDTINRVLQELETMRLLRRRQLVSDLGRWSGVAYYLADLDDSSIEVGFYHTKDNNHTTIKSLEERKAIFKDLVVEAYRKKEHRLPATEAKKFFEYWSEVNDGGSVMRFEKEKNKGTFNVAQRLDTWIRNYSKFRGFTNNKQKPILKTTNT